VDSGAGSMQDRTRPHALRDYALLADGERGAVVGPRGEIVWMCAPRWDSDAVFTALVGGEAAYTVTPRSRFVWGGYYEQSSLIWRSRWVTDDGSSNAARRWRFPASRTAPSASYAGRRRMCRRTVVPAGPERSSTRSQTWLTTQSP
jgi:Domain of unknown function (DUF5911)